MKLAIMQPYFFPYIGYFQLINAVDTFVLYDDIEFTRKGWINRNRILVNGKDAFITIPLRSDSDYLNVRDRYLADTWVVDRKKMLNRISETYRKSPNFNSVFPLIEEILNYEERNLFKFILNSVIKISDFLNIKTNLLISSDIVKDSILKSEDRVIELCKALKTTNYLNPIGGLTLYSKNRFLAEGLNLNFLKTNDFQYLQFSEEFTPHLSIIDVLMFNSKERIQKDLLNDYSLI
jgi:WbqC-like protein family